MTAIQLSPTERKAHRADAHHLDPVILVGNDGLTEAVIKETELALLAHGLIKVRMSGDDRKLRESALAQLADRLNAAPVQHIGKLLVLWRPKVEAAKQDALRDVRMPGPRVVKLVTSSGSGNHRPQVKRVTVMGNQRVTAGGLIKRAKKKRMVSVKKNPP